MPGYWKKVLATQLVNALQDHKTINVGDVLAAGRNPLHFYQSKIISSLYSRGYLQSL